MRRLMACAVARQRPPARKRRRTRAGVQPGAHRRSTCTISPPIFRTSPLLLTNVDVWFPDDGLDLERYIEGVELTLIRRSLERTQGNKRQAAKLLNLKRTTLIEKLKRLEPHAALPKLP